MKTSFKPVWAGLCALALMTAALGAAPQPVSFYNDILPLFKRSCTGCHHPGKLKGQLDLTTYEALKKGGKHGPGFVAGEPKASILIEEVSGSEPSMPKEGEPLSKEEVALIERWIEEGAKDDTPADAASFKLAAPPTYRVPPVISALAYSPEGKHLAVSAYHEVLLFNAGNHQPAARLVGESPRIESVAFSPNGRLLGVAGGAPARFGEVQIWDVTTGQQIQALKLASDSLYGISFANEGDRVAVGGADKIVRILRISDGQELVKFDNHSDWVFGTLWTVDGTRLLTGSRDRAMKLIQVANGQFIDDINKLLEPVLCLARHPAQDLVAYGGELGTPRIYRISDNQGRTAANYDVNLVRELERQPDAVRAIAYSRDGNLVAVAGSWDEVRLYNPADGKRAHALKGHTGAIFALAFQPLKNQLLTGGFDGKLRLYDTTSGNLVSEFLPVTLEAVPRQAAAAAAGSAAPPQVPAVGSLARAGVEPENRSSNGGVAQRRRAAKKRIRTDSHPNGEVRAIPKGRVLCDLASLREANRRFQAESIEPARDPPRAPGRAAVMPAIQRMILGGSRPLRCVANHPRGVVDGKWSKALNQMRPVFGLVHPNSERALFDLCFPARRFHFTGARSQS